MYVDRTTFVAWSQGILLDRDSKGRVIVGDSLAAEEAVKLHDEGKEDIILTVNGKPFSIIAVGAYDEVEI